MYSEGVSIFASDFLALSTVFDCEIFIRPLSVYRVLLAWLPNEANDWLQSEAIDPSHPSRP